MPRLNFLRYAVLSAAFCISFSAFAGDSLETAALAAWEKMQQNDPTTVTFRKTGERTYDFSSKHFDYSGVIKVVAVDIEDLEGYGLDSSFIYRASIDVELDKRSRDDCESYGRGYYRWLNQNSLYYSRPEGRWMTSAEYAKTLQKLSRERMALEQRKENSLGNRLKPFYALTVWAIVIVLLFVFFNSLYHNVKLIGTYQKEIIAQLRTMNERLKKE